MASATSPPVPPQYSLISSKPKHFTSFLIQTKPFINPNNNNLITLPSFSSSSKSPLLHRVECNSATARYNEVAVVDEEMDKIRRLQNGSDVRGVAIDGEKGRHVDLTPPAVEAIAESFGEWVVGELEREREAAAARVSLGRDPRISGGVLSVAVFAGLSRAGCVVFDMGLATTPACFMSTLLEPFAYDASMMMNDIISLAIHTKWSEIFHKERRPYIAIGGRDL